MASGSIVEEGGGKDAAREKQRYSESKVYTRKAFKGPRNNINNINNLTTTAPKNTIATATTNTNDKDRDRDLTTPSTTATTTTATTTEAENNKENGYKDDTNEKKNENNTVQVPESQTPGLEDTNSAQQKKIENNTVQVPESQTPGLEDTNSAQQKTFESNTIQVPESQTPCLEDTNSAQQKKDENSTIQVPESQTPSLEDTNSAQQKKDENSTIQVPESQTPGLQDTNSAQQKNDENNTIQVPESQTPGLEDTNSAQQPPIVGRDANSDDSSSLNRQQDTAAVANIVREPPAENGTLKQGLEKKVKINLASKSKQEKKELRRKLESELDIVRSLVKKIEAKERRPPLVVGFSNTRVTPNDRVDNGFRRVNSDVGSVGIPRESTTPIVTPTPRQTRPLNQLSISVLENNQGAGEFVEKEKRTPKANQFYRNSEFLLAKDKFPPAESNKKSKLNGKRHGGGDSGFGFSTGSKVFKNCSTLLDKLMKHKHGWVFNAPVDVKTLGLHDYFTIIKHPMDLGTVKTKLNKNWYKSPEEFAEDVRLTFHNAMTYNPKGQDVHIMAEMLLQIFEERWAVIKSEYDRDMRFPSSYDLGIPTPASRKTPLLPPPLDMRRIFDRSEFMAYPSTDPRPKSISTTPSGRTPAPKKPKAKDPHKRDMTYEEKQKLSTNLQGLPSEKLDNIVQIIKKRNSTLSQHDDEIEVDIDSVDAETLWELDRFVTNYKKSLSKNKRKAELAIARAEAQQNVQQKAPAEAFAGAPQETRTDERNTTTSSPVQVGNPGDNGTRSSSSSSSSSDSGSSSSDSDSDSSSASGS
ncbi:transcription factor GTE4-like isoform X2 [Euphorbia lathyris]|uniref:transcription factor GTE4-like isoform X2 n=1 Tax=Euphorbia lathyris TaxID=212925 RepID=UPI003313D348